MVVEPWSEQKIQAALNKENSDYVVKIEQVHISVFLGSIDLEAIKVYSKQDTGINHAIHGEIAWIKLAGISRFKALFKNDFDIREIFISDPKISVKLPPPTQEKKPHIVSPVNVRIGKIHVENLDLAVKNLGASKFFSLKNGHLEVHEVQVSKKDTLSSRVAEKVNFNFREFLLISSDSLYSLTLKDVDYDLTKAIFSIDTFLIHPNYKDYDFTSRHKYETDRIDGTFINIAAHDFSLADYLKSLDFKSTYLEIGKMNLDVFRDKRKVFPPFNRPTLQQLIYDYPALLNVDSVGVLRGDVFYREHAEEANEAGSISFNKIKAKIYNITNDTIYRTQSKFLELKSEALVMGKGKLIISIKAKLFDKLDAFSLTGHLAAMDAKILNPILEKNAFLFVTSGDIDAMNFNIEANNNRATGSMTLRYQGLDIALKNKRTDDTTGLKERVVSWIADLKIVDSNPLPGEAVRTGIIDYERDPQRFFFNYASKAILTGIQSSLEKNPKKKKK
ncbi:MAG: hypothetical protein ACKV1O_21720 [Saprospiraceae bacterium]